MLLQKAATTFKNGMLTKLISYQLEGIAIRLLSIKRKGFDILKLNKTR